MNTTPATQIKFKYIQDEVKSAIKNIKQANRGIGVEIDPDYVIRWIDVYSCFSLLINYTDGNGKKDFYSIAL